MIKVEVAYADLKQQLLLEINVEPNTTILDTILASKILDLIENENINIDGLKVGIFGKEKTLDYQVQDKDRIEIYRPLVQDPKELRRLREKENKKGRNYTEDR